MLSLIFIDKKLQSCDYYFKITLKEKLIIWDFSTMNKRNKKKSKQQ